MGKSSFAASKFSERSFWDKLANQAKVAKRKVVEAALTLFYATKAPETPAWAKTVIYTALVYFIVPLDGVPDPFYGDDLGVLLTALATVAAYITPEIEEKAQQKAHEWFS